MADRPLKSGNRFDTDQTRNILPQDVVSLARSNRNQRCFSQFDRKTDCYRNGFLRRGEYGKTAKPSWLGLKLFTVAVCGTQTRHGVSVNKEEADSQIALMVVSAALTPTAKVTSMEISGKEQ